MHPTQLRISCYRAKCSVHVQCFRQQTNEILKKIFLPVKHAPILIKQAKIIPNKIDVIRQLLTDYKNTGK